MRKTKVRIKKVKGKGEDKEEGGRGPHRCSHFKNRNMGKRLSIREGLGQMGVPGCNPKGSIQKEGGGGGL